MVGYAIGRSIDARLAKAALEAAVRSRRPPADCIHYSDRGSQYASAAYRKNLVDHGLVGSMIRLGNRYDNAKAESFMKTLKVEAVYPMAYETTEDVATDLPRFIDDVYNAIFRRTGARSRSRSSFGGSDAPRRHVVSGYSQSAWPVAGSLRSHAVRSASMPSSIIAGWRSAADRPPSSPAG